MYLRVAKEVGFTKPINEWSEAEFAMMRSFAAVLMIEGEELELHGLDK